MKKEETLVVKGTSEGIASIKKIIAAIGKKAAVGAGVTVMMESGDGTEKIGYMDGDGNAHVSVSNNRVLDVNPMSSESKRRGSARSKMLKMVMPMLSNIEGQELQRAIESGNPAAAETAMKKIGKRLREQMDAKKK